MEKKIYLVHQGVLRGVNREFHAQRVFCAFSDFLIAVNFCNLQNNIRRDKNSDVRFTCDPLIDVLSLDNMDL